MKFLSICLLLITPALASIGDLTFVEVGIPFIAKAGAYAVKTQSPGYISRLIHITLAKVLEVVSANTTNRNHEPLVAFHAMELKPSTDAHCTAVSSIIDGIPVNLPPVCLSYSGVYLCHTNASANPTICTGVGVAKDYNLTFIGSSSATILPTGEDYYVNGEIRKRVSTFSNDSGDFSLVERDGSITVALKQPPVPVVNVDSTIITCGIFGDDTYVRFNGVFDLHYIKNTTCIGGSLHPCIIPGHHKRLCTETGVCGVCQETSVRYILLLLNFMMFIGATIDSCCEWREFVSAETPQRRRKLCKTFLLFSFIAVSVALSLFVGDYV